MAKATICDICGKVCDIDRYEVIASRFFIKTKYDICEKCFKIIKKAVKGGKQVESE